jgi:hypothetical protein
MKRKISVLAIAYFAHCDAADWRRLSMHPSLLGRKRWDWQTGFPVCWPLSADFSDFVVRGVISRAPRS